MPTRVMYTVSGETNEGWKVEHYPDQCSNPEDKAERVKLAYAAVEKFKSAHTPTNPDQILVTSEPLHVTLTVTAQDGKEWKVEHYTHTISDEFDKATLAKLANESIEQFKSAHLSNSAENIHVTSSFH
jgi:hypothetical protein